MTTIKCSSKCIHQHDGACTLENTTSNSISTETDCAFFEEIPNKKDMVFIAKKQNELICNYRQ